ncbi:MAG: TonB-dependent receptor, partial [Bacteroidetes bacterium]|nr:TonB-dependent receptor [Bacteroidota bacterium]
SLSDQQGNFSFENIKDGQYLLSVTMAGYKKLFVKTEVAGKDVQLDTIRLLSGAAVLGEVTVTAVKPFLEQKADRLIVNVEGSATAAGATAFEVLQKIPGVLVINDKLSVVGKGAPAIMIDGRLSQYTDITQVLREMSAADIARIELTTNPGAKYDATGGAVINIILKRNANLGTNGSLNLNGGMSLYNRNTARTDRNFYRHGEGISINHREGKWNLFAGYSFLHRNFFDYNEFDRLINPSRFFQTNYAPGYVNSHTYRAGVDYYADKKNTFGVMIRGFSRKGLTAAENSTLQSDAANGQPVSNFQTFNTTGNQRNNISANGNWKHSFDSSGKELNMDIDYSRFSLSNASDIINRLSNGSQYPSRQVIDNPVRLLVLKTDYVQPFGKNAKLEAGVKSAIATIDNDLRFTQNDIPDKNRSTDFAYRENINAAYASFQQKFAKWELQGGLRTEQTIATGKTQGQKVLDRNYWQLFPSVFVTRSITKDLSGIVQYSRRVNRPSYQQQNPFVQYLDSLTYTKGNPLLKPETADQYKFSLAYKHQPFFSVSYNKKHDVIFDDAPNQNGNLTYTTPENLASYENIAIELNFPIELGKKISGYAGNQAVYNHYKASYLGAVYDRAKWNWLAYWQVAYKPKPSWSVEISGYYTTQLLNEFIVVNNMESLNLAIQKFLWKKKGRLSLNVSDVFFGQRTKGDVIYEQINVHFREWSDSRNIRLTFTYSFGNQQLKAARNRQTASDEETQRVKTQ